MGIKFEWLSVILLVLVSCTGKNNQKPDFEKATDDTLKIEIFQIDPRTFEENELTLADFAADVEYIPFSNTISIGSIQALKITSEAIYLVSDASSGGEGNGHQELFRFNKNGEDPVQIGKIGRGPEEYLICTYFTVNEQNNRIYINGKLNTVMVFDTKGKYLRDFKFQNPDTRYSKIELLGDKHLLVPEMKFGAQTQYLWTITDTLGNIISEKNNTTLPFESRSGPRGGVYSYKGNVSSWVEYNDTIFTISPDFSYHASYIITPGEHRKPREDIPFSLDLPIRLLEFYSPHYFMETNTYLISRFNFKGKIGFLFIDKTNQKTSVSYFDWKRDEIGGIPNNYDGGLEFSPDVYFTDGKDEFLAGTIQPFSLKAYVSSNSFKNSTPKYPEKKKELEQLANSLNESDNPVLMLVKLKE